MIKNRAAESIATTSLQPTAWLPAPPVDASDLIDWDFVIETAPRRPSGTIRARLVHSGRSRPLPVNERGISLEDANGDDLTGIVKQ